MEKPGMSSSASASDPGAITTVSATRVKARVATPLVVTAASAAALPRVEMSDSDAPLLSY